MTESGNMPEIARSDPPYAQVVAYIRAKIASGELVPGDMVPSARKITEQWQVSLATATKVLAALRSEGLVEARPGIGTVVSEGVIEASTPRDRAISARRSGKIYRNGERAQVVAAKLVPAPEAVAAAFSIEPGTPMIRRHRVTFRDEQPASASTSWFAGDLAETAPRLLSTERIRQGTWRYVEETTGQVVVSGRDELSAGAATEQEGTDLRVELGSPVLRGRNWYLDAEGGVVEYGESVALPDRWSAYEYEVAH